MPYTKIIIMKRTVLAIVIIAVIAVIGIALFLLAGKKLAGPGGAPGGTIRIVAAEDFYGNIAAQIAGDKANVLSIISNPNIDPHEYDATVQDGIAVAQADIVIENGLNYDTWMDKLIGASPNPSRTVIVAGTTPGVAVLPENPHVWYGISNMAAVAQAIAHALAAKDPGDEAMFAANLKAFDASLAPIAASMDAIKAAYAGTPVALTETIYRYQTGPMGLRVLTPATFERAIAEGNDPSAQDVSAVNAEIAGMQAKILIYNSQTITPVTTNIENAAIANGIPVVPVTETMPTGDTYQSWMAGQLATLQAALAKAAGK